MEFKKIYRSEVEKPQGKVSIRLNRKSISFNKAAVEDLKFNTEDKIFIAESDGEYYFFKTVDKEGMSLLRRHGSVSIKNHQCAKDLFEVSNKQDENHGILHYQEMPYVHEGFTVFKLVK